MISNTLLCSSLINPFLQVVKDLQHILSNLQAERWNVVCKKKILPELILYLTLYYSTNKWKEPPNVLVPIYTDRNLHSTNEWLSAFEQFIWFLCTISAANPSLANCRSSYLLIKSTISWSSFPFVSDFDLSKIPLFQIDHQIQLPILHISRFRLQGYQ